MIDMYERFGLFLDGAWHRAADGGMAEVLSPVTERPLGSVPVATREDTDAALTSAAQGLAAWRHVGGYARADALHKIADEMMRRTGEGARAITLETGKPLAQSERGGAWRSTSSVGMPRRHGVSTAALWNHGCQAVALRSRVSRSGSWPHSPPGTFRRRSSRARPLQHWRPGARSSFDHRARHRALR